MATTDPLLHAEISNNVVSLSLHFPLEANRWCYHLRMLVALCWKFDLNVQSRGVRHAVRARALPLRDVVDRCLNGLLDRYLMGWSTRRNV